PHAGPLDDRPGPHRPGPGRRRRPRPRADLRRARATGRCAGGGALPCGLRAGGPRRDADRQQRRPRRRVLRLREGRAGPGPAVLAADPGRAGRPAGAVRPRGAAGRGGVRDPGPPGARPGRGTGAHRAARGVRGRAGAARAVARRRGRGGPGHAGGGGRGPAAHGLHVRVHRPPPGRGAHPPDLLLDQPVAVPDHRAVRARRGAGGAAAVPRRRVEHPAAAGLVDRRHRGARAHLRRRPGAAPHRGARGDDDDGGPHAVPHDGRAPGLRRDRLLPGARCRGRGRADAGAAGKPYPHVDVALAEPATGEHLQGPGTGELLVRGPGTFAGYFRDPEATAAVWRDGWLATGDVATRDEDGYLRIVDRLKNIYISGGENVAPAEVEQVLRRHPGVRDVVVVGVPDHRWGEVGIALVVTRPGVPCDEQELLEHARGELASYKVPAEVHLVDELPHVGLEKVDRPRALELALAARAAARTEGHR